TQTPILLYKMDHVAETSRRTVMREDMPVRFSGLVRRGSVSVTVLHERPARFQPGAQGRPETTVFERTYRTGEQIALNEVFQPGGGECRLEVAYQAAPGVFRLHMPGGGVL